MQNQRHEFEDSLDECVSNAPDVNGYDDEAVAGCPATRKSFNIEVCFPWTGILSLCNVSDKWLFAINISSMKYFINHIM